MNYFEFLLVFVGVPLVILLLMAFRKGKLTQFNISGILVLSLIALVYTTPWDNYLIFRGVWTYPPDAVVGKLGYVPLEEYGFMILQTWLAGVLFALLPFSREIPTLQFSPLASFLSGLYPQSTGVLNNTFDIRKTRPGTVSMPHFFKENGYWTASVGKVFHNTKSDHGEIAWHENLRFENDELAVVHETRLKFEAEHGSIDKQANKKKWKELKKLVTAKLDAQTPPGRGRSGLTDAQHKDGKNTRQVVRWLEDKDYGHKPFFIALGLQKPHVPFLAPDKYFDLYPYDKIRYQIDRPNMWDFLPPSALSKRYEAFGFEFSKENHILRKEYIQAYHACVSFIDAQLGLVMDSLKKQGLWDDTIIIFTSDHGYHLGDHFIWGKVTLFDIGAKVPFIVRAPGLSKSGANSEAMVELIDIYPTLADLAGLEAPIHLQGTSLLPLLGNPERLGKKKYAYSVVTRGPKKPWLCPPQPKLAIWEMARW